MAIYHLVYGGKTLNLNDLTTYMLQEGFYPPAAGAQADLAYGLGLNRSGGTMVDEKALDRQWTFPILVLGDSITETGAAVRQLQSFLNLAQNPAGGYPAEKLYLEYHPSGAIPTRPVYGQGFYRYWIKWGKVHLTSEYGALPFDKQIKAEVELVVGPYALGQRQILLTGSGGIIEDDLGSENGMVRGTVIAPATVNLFTNPVHQYEWAGNWYQSWIKGSNLSYWQNRDMEYVVYGVASMGVIRIGATNINLTQSLMATNTNTWLISALFKRQDWAAVTESLVKIFYDTTARATTFIPLAYGWYLGYATVTGVASVKATGIQMQAENISLFSTGYMFFEGSYPVPACYGDQVGCTWGTVAQAHNSATTRTAGNLWFYLRTMIDIDQFQGREYFDQGTIRMAVRWWYPSTFGSDQYLIDCGAFKAYYRASDDKIVLTDGTNTIATAAQTFAANDLVVLNFVVGPGSMKIYKDGVEAATASAYVPVAALTAFYFGSTAAAGSQGCMTILDGTIWNEMASASQVLADYTDMYEQISGGDGFGQRMNALPWLWTEDGAELDLYQDSTHMDAMILGGIPGDTVAETEYYIHLNVGGNSLLMALNASRIPLNLREEFQDVSGSVVAGALGGEVYRMAVNTTPVLIPAGAIINIQRLRQAYYGKPCYVYAVMADAGVNLTARLSVYTSLTYVLAGDYKPIGADGTRRGFLIGPAVMPDGPDREFHFIGWLTTLDIYIQCVRTVAGSANVDLDFYRLLTGRVAYCLAQDNSSIDFKIKDGRGYGFTNPFLRQMEECQYQGDVLDVEPNQYNYLTILSGDLNAAVINTNNVTIWYVVVTPRWMIL